MARRPVTDPTRAIGYIRVSTSEQALGLDAQRAALASWCASRGVELVAIHEDRGVSGAAELTARPGMLAALAALKASRAGLLLVAKRDRLARDVVTAGLLDREVARLGARIASAAGEGEGDDPVALFTRRLFDAVAELERAKIADRTRRALAVKRERGEKLGGDRPLGRTVAADGRTLVADPEEARALEIIRSLRDGGWSIRGIVAELEKLGVPARGSRWHATSVARLLSRAA